MNKILISGSSGQLGSIIYKKIINLNNFKVIFLNKDLLDLTDKDKTLNFFKENKFHYFINCAAFTNVDAAETNKEKVNLINYIFIETIVNLLIQSNTKIIHFSTDYVFDGQKNDIYNESDPANPLNHYGFSKLMSEKVLLNSHIQGIIIRTSILYSDIGNNLFLKIVEKLNKSENLEIIHDQYVTTTNAYDIADFVFYIFNSDTITLLDNKIKVLNFVNNGICNLYEFVGEISKFFHKENLIKKINFNEYKFIAKRPKFSALDNSKIKNLYNYKIKDWTDSINVLLKYFL